MSAKDILQEASREVRDLIESVLEIEMEGKNYKNLPQDVEQDIVDRLIKLIDRSPVS